MAQYFYHGFNAQFSIFVLLIAVSVIAAAYLMGYWSVRIAPRKTRRNSEEKPADMPRYNRAKARSLNKLYARKIRRLQYDNTAIIVLKSTTFDNLIGIIGGGVFTWAFAHEHIDGMIQWFINHLSANDSAIWGDILAYASLCFLFAFVAEIAKFVCRVGQNHKARAFAEAFMAESVRPVFGERRSLGFMARLVGYVVRKEAEEKAAKANAAIEQQKAKIAERENNVVQMLPGSDRAVRTS